MSGAPPGCLSDDELQAVAEGTLSLARRTDVDEHLDGCIECRETLAELLRGQAPGADDDLWRGERIGRYTVAGVVGRGAAAVVLRAHDPELDRAVAIKLLVDGGLPSRDALVEARAMARVAHRNVVAVYDAGTYDGGVYVAMELVEGETLASYLAAADRPWREILDAFLAAGEGLAAAHAAGVVHGDVKPENVLVARDGRVCIGDFGLARATAVDDADPVAAPAGTPLYMAPELLRGAPSDARSDQFALCVALYRALYREHPFGDPTVPLTAAGLARALTEGEPRRPSHGRGVPKAVWRALRRGLAVAPSARHVDVVSLLLALRRAARSPRRRMVVIGTAAGVAVAIAAAALRPQPARCGDGRIRAGVEECDDGNTVDGDGCSSRCLACTGVNAELWNQNGHCYTRDDRPATWFEAQVACDREGGHLVTYDLAAEQEFVSRALAPAGPFWLGLARAPGGAFAWPTDAPLAMSYWAQGEPAAATGAQCVQQLATAAAPPNQVRRGWRTADCDARAPFVCEREGWQVEPRTGHAFLWIAERLTWDEAVLHCRNRGAHLATLATDAEADFVSLHGRQVAWLGGSDRAQPGHFSWMTGEPFARPRFGPTQPDNDARPSECLVLGVDGSWYDRGCSARYASICERD